MEEIVNLINTYGFPIVAAVGMGYFIYVVWKWITEDVMPTLDAASATLIALIDRIRMLDNDLIRMNQKLNVILTLKEQENELKSRLDRAEDLLKAHHIKLPDYDTKSSGEK